MVTLVAQERKGSKKTALKRLRNGGEIPAVVYGNSIETKSIKIGKADFVKATRAVGRNGILSLDLDGKFKDVILRDYQNNPVTKEILHVDFLQVDKHTEIDTKVKVILKGTSSGEKAGGILKQYLHELDITVKVNDIPEDIEIDITDFEIGHTVRVADIKKDYQNCTFKHEDEEPIAMIDYVKPESEEEQEPSETDAPAV